MKIWIGIGFIFCCLSFLTSITFAQSEIPNADTWIDQTATTLSGSHDSSIIFQLNTRHSLLKFSIKETVSSVNQANITLFRSDSHSCTDWSEIGFFSQPSISWTETTTWQNKPNDMTFETSKQSNSFFESFNFTCQNVGSSFTINVTNYITNQLAQGISTFAFRLSVLTSSSPIQSFGVFSRESDSAPSLQYTIITLDPTRTTLTPSTFSTPPETTTTSPTAPTTSISVGNTVASLANSSSDSTWKTAVIVISVLIGVCCLCCIIIAIIVVVRSRQRPNVEGLIEAPDMKPKSQRVSTREDRSESDLYASKVRKQNRVSLEPNTFLQAKSSLLLKEDERKQLIDLDTLLLHDDLVLTRGIIRSLWHDDSNASLLSEALVKIYAPLPEMNCEILKFIIQNEVKKSNEVNELLQPDSFCSRFLFRNSTTVGKEYLDTLLNPFFEFIIENDVIVEINPDRLNEIALNDLEDNLELTIELTEKIFNQLRNTQTQIPRQIQMICFSLTREISLKYSHHTTKILGAYFFLRFLLPTLTAPQLQMPAEYHRTLTIVAKMLGKFANEGHFLESHYSLLNKWLKRNMSDLYRFYEGLILCENNFERVEVPDKLRLDALIVIQNYIDKNLSYIKKEVGGEMSMDVAEYFAAIEAKKRNLSR